MKLLTAGAMVLVLGLLTTGCSSGSKTAAAASSTSGGASATSAAAGAAAASSSGTPAGGPSTTAQSAAASQDLSSAAATTTPGGSGAASPGSTSSATGGRAGPVAVCATLPASQVASLSGTAVTSSREQDFAANNDYTCAYNTASGVGGLSVTVAVVGGALAYTSSLSTDTVAGSAEHVTPVAGIGDKAFSARDGLRALFGDRMIYVAGLTSAPPAEAIIKALQAKLP